MQKLELAEGVKGVPGDIWTIAILVDPELVGFIELVGDVVVDETKLLRADVGCYSSVDER